METKKIYIASPLGFCESGRDFYYNKIIPIFNNIGFEVIDPWKLTSEEEVLKVVNMPFGEEKRKAWSELSYIIGKNNAKGLNRANGVFAILDGVDVDSGTASEIGFANAIGIPILGYRNDFRFAGDNEGVTVNLQVEYFIKQSGGQIINNIEELPQMLNKVFD